MIRPQPSKYGPPAEGCPVTECLHFLSASWTPEILWFLHGQTRRFGDLRRDLAGISAKVLTVRLRDLERRGVVRRSVKATSPPTVEYSLTELGLRFTPVMEQLAALGGCLLDGAATSSAHGPPGSHPAEARLRPGAARRA